LDTLLRQILPINIYSPDAGALEPFYQYLPAMMLVDKLMITITHGTSRPPRWKGV